MTSMKIMLFKASKIRADDVGRICLNDIHKAAGFSTNKTPTNWYRLENTLKEIEVVISKKIGRSGNWSKEERSSAFHISRRAGNEIWADEVLALSYAAFLSPRLSVEINEVFLRYKKGDETLIPEIHQNKRRREDSVRQQHRVIGKGVRKDFTSILKDHGIEKSHHYVHCTNEVYKPILGGTAVQIRTERGLPKKTNLRDHMTVKELAYTMAAEALATERIEQSEAAGYVQCRNETALASTAIGGAITSDRKSRDKKLI